MFAIIDKDGAVVEYPVDPGILNPNVSFAADWEGGVMHDLHYVRVEHVPMPDVHPTKNIAEGIPVLDGAVWKQTWSITDASAGEIASRRENMAQTLRSDRAARLMACDWTQLADVPAAVQTAWRDYRQALRDLPDQPGFPFDVVWPTPPVV